MALDIRKYEKKVRYVIDIDDYEGTHLPEFKEAVDKCHKYDDRFRVNIFAIPGMMTGGNVVEMLSDQRLIPCLHGYFHTQGECLNWTKDMALRALLWAENAGFQKVFRPPYWEISDGVYEAILERKWTIADHRKNGERILKHGLFKRAYFYEHDLVTVGKMGEKEIWNLPDPVKIHGGVKHLDSLVSFMEKLSNIGLILPTFMSIFRFVKLNNGRE